MREPGCPSKQFEGHLQFPLFFEILLANIGKKFALGGCKVGEVSFDHLFHFFFTSYLSPVIFLLPQLLPLLVLSSLRIPIWLEYLVKTLLVVLYSQFERIVSWVSSPLMT